MSPASRIAWATAAALPAICSIISMSPPAENALPAPVTSTTFTAGSSSIVFQICVSSQCMRALVAFSTSGRFSVTSRTPFGFKSNFKC